MPKILNHQTYLDIAMQECGNAGYALAIAAGQAQSLTKNLVAGDEVTVPAITLSAQEKSIAYVLSKKEFLPASNDDVQINAPDGIGYMAIGSTFIVR